MSNIMAQWKLGELPNVRQFLVRYAIIVISDLVDWAAACSVGTPGTVFEHIVNQSVSQHHMYCERWNDLTILLAIAQALVCATTQGTLHLAANRTLDRSL